MSDTIKFVNKEEHACPHCEIKNEVISEFIGYLKELQDNQGELSTQQLVEELEFFYDEAHDNGKRFAFAQVGQYAEYRFNQTLKLDENDEKPEH